MDKLQYDVLTVRCIPQCCDEINSERAETLPCSRPTVVRQVLTVRAGASLYSVERRWTKLFKPFCEVLTKQWKSI